MTQDSKSGLMDRVPLVFCLSFFFFFLIQYTTGPILKKAATFGGFHIKNIVSYIPVFAFWGAAAGAGVATFTENWPLFQKTFYTKIPVIGNHWIHEVDPEEQSS